MWAFIGGNAAALNNTLFDKFTQDYSILDFYLIYFRKRFDIQVELNGN